MLPDDSDHSEPAAQIAAAQFANTRNADEDKRESEQMQIAEKHDQSSQLLFNVLQ